MSIENGHAHAETEIYYLHMRPAERSLRELPLGSEWYSDDPEEITYVSTARPVFAARMDAIREKLASHGIVSEGPLICADENAAKKSQHDTWVLRVPAGKALEAHYATQSIGSIVGPVRKEAAVTLEAIAPVNGHALNGKTNGVPAAILKRMQSGAVTTESL